MYDNLHIKTGIPYFFKEKCKGKNTWLIYTHSNYGFIYLYLRFFIEAKINERSVTKPKFKKY
jgi:hypothetical protein